MEQISITSIKKKVSRIGLGTWAIGGSLWGGTNEIEALDTIKRAFSYGINFIDTAPGYGNGASEEIVGKAIKQYGKRESLVIATKFGLNLENNGCFRDSRKEFIKTEIENSLKRLQVDYIDLYQIHWPDPKTPLEETAETLNILLQEGKIRAIGVSNFSIEEMRQLQKFIFVSASQFPFNLYEREAEKDHLPYCKQNNMTTIAYSPICRGLLSGKMNKERIFKEDDLRKNMDPKFQEPRFSAYLNCSKALSDWVMEKYQRPLIALAMRWVLDKQMDIVLWGARKPEQLENIDKIEGWKLSEIDFEEIDKILAHWIKDPIGPQFMAPPIR